MVDKDLIRLRHMSDSILSFIKGKKRESLDKERLLLSGIIRELEIIGEAAGKVSLETRERFPDFAWAQMIGMRNRLIHAYFDVNHDVVWKTVTEVLPSLSIRLANIIQNFNS